MIYALIVIYNKKIDSSTTFKCINKDKRLNLIIYDNSLDNKYNKEFAKKNKIEYYTINKNVGLSKAYNYVIRKHKMNDNDYIMILDDDTEITNNYLDEVDKIINSHEYDIILPIVKSNKRMMSPSNIQFNCRVKRVKDISKLKMNKITAINSGMVVKKKVYNDIKYDENLFLDYVDHLFMKNIRNRNYSIYVMNSFLNQNYSRDQKQSFESVKFRFNIFKKDFKYYCKKCNRILFYYVSLLKLRLVYLIKYKKIV